MSRPNGAWTEGCALAGAVVRGASKWARRGHHLRGERARLPGAVLSSISRPVVVLALGALVAGAMPASALAQSGHAKSTSSHKHIKHTPQRTRAGSRLGEHARSRADGRPTTVRLGGDVLLAPGAGYSSPGGSALVRALQLRLARAGDQPGPIDGRYGPLTEQAVVRFQAAHGLAADGLAGPVTLAALTSATPVLYPGAGYAESRGFAGVRVLQKQLTRLGVSPGPVDGRYGPMTTRAVERFQSTHGLQVDGIVGERTGRALHAGGRRALTFTHKHSRKSRRSVSKPHAARRSATNRRSSGTVRQHQRAPMLPIVLILLGVTAMGLGMAVLVYERRRAKAQRARERVPSWATIYAARPPSRPEPPRERDRPLTGATEEQDR